MLIKSCCLGAVLLSTPLCLMNAQGGGTDRVVTPAAQLQDPRPQQTAGSEKLSRRQQVELEEVRRELKGAKRDLAAMRRQLNELLDSMEASFARQQHRSCSPSRNRALMSHYQWLERNNHPERAGKALASIVEQAGSKVDQLNTIAWDLMTDKDTFGEYDRVALALAERMEASSQRLRHHYIDTIALARFLNGQVDRAVALQKKAIEAGGSSDDYRRRLRTYEAAQKEIQLARRKVPAAGARGVAAATANDEEDDG